MKKFFSNLSRKTKCCVIWFAGFAGTLGVTCVAATQHWIGTAVFFGVMAACGFVGFACNAIDD